jgi:hypothetical protein
MSKNIQGDAYRGRESRDGMLTNTHGKSYDHGYMCTDKHVSRRKRCRSPAANEAPDPLVVSSRSLLFSGWCLRESLPDPNSGFLERA